jgi:hypothetical protein
LTYISIIENMSITLVHAKTRLLVYVLNYGRVYSMRTCVGTEFTSRLVYNSSIGNRPRSITMIHHQNRHLSSARPLPDDEHEEHGWHNNEQSINRGFKRETSFTTSQPNYLNEDTIVSTTTNTNTTKENLPLIRPTDTSTIITATQTAEALSPSKLRYTGDAVIPITSVLHIVKPQEDIPRGIWPVFRLLVSYC